MLIRTATIADIPAIRSLAHEIWHTHYPAIIPVAQIGFMLGWMYSAEEIARQLATDTRWELAELDSQLIGFLSYGLEADRRVKLHKLYIATAHQRRGIGQKMLAHLLAQATTLGGTEVWMQVNKRNTTAIAAYIKAGFHIAQEATFDIGHGFIMDDFLMARSVA
jgi:ribosomal protein S18 acetylase RimI-like enzyme